MSGGITTTFFMDNLYSVVCACTVRGKAKVVGYYIFLPACICYIC